MALDPSSHIQEVKALTVDVRPGPAPARAGALRARARLPRSAPASPRTRECAMSDDEQRPLHALLEGADPARVGRARAPSAAHGLLHGHVGLHRLQGLRGGVQGVEPGARGRPRLARAMSHDNSGGLGADTWRHVAFIEQRAPDRDARRELPARRRGVPLADVVGRLQALHALGVPRRLPDRRDLPLGVRHGRRAGGHLQRLRLLRAGVPLRRDRPARGRRPGLQVHDVLRPARSR